MGSSWNSFVSIRNNLSVPVLLSCLELKASVLAYLLHDTDHDTSGIILSFLKESTDFFQESMEFLPEMH